MQLFLIITIVWSYLVNFKMTNIINRTRQIVHEKAMVYDVWLSSSAHYLGYMSRYMRFPTIRHFDMNRLRRAHAASF